MVASTAVDGGGVLGVAAAETDADGVAADAAGGAVGGGDGVVAGGASDWIAAETPGGELADGLCGLCGAADATGGSDDPAGGGDALAADDSDFALAVSVIFAAGLFLAEPRFGAAGASGPRATDFGGSGAAGSGAGAGGGGVTGIGVTTGGGGTASTGAAACVATAATGEAVVPVPASRQTAIPRSTISGTHSIATLAGVMPREPGAGRCWLSQPILESVGDGVSSERSAEIR